MFSTNGYHDVPPDFIMPLLWRPELEALAAQLGFPVSSAAEIEKLFRETVLRIAPSR